jgi:GntR family transcriptional repressor for pyruvate dehydrogenase complex
MANLSTARAPGNANGTAFAARAIPERPQQRSRNRTYELVEGIGAQIKSGALLPGQKLPTELQIMRNYGVSRTVVREALSKLQAAGMVETRHGIGTFVLEPQPPMGFSIAPADLATAADVLAALELRISLETESAGLAAERRTQAQLADLRFALDRLASNAGGAGDTVAPDFRFHLVIARATGNRYFVDIMNHLGATLIPRARINSPGAAMEDLPAYMRRLNREHENIYEAIARRDAKAARTAMRVHLTNSRERLRRAQALAQDKTLGQPAFLGPGANEATDVQQQTKG